ncbi:glutamine amidotransferase-related protein [Pseudomonas trivialis]|uniref:GMP synthase (Glutamine-hydrolysing) n=1 Tax=Pseudomonas trivialis TaxID=200450 RepID=A0A0R2ZRK7_9PSED|nr:glutamine amidotransferase [Pseudomonas trivialis]KRP63386.1 glutamine amidotransferase [Pseudomonas trivialis]SDR91002.1 GMP synthase (glutamine-hydrolysing) [Pseudomonas trivialis]
MNVHFVMHEAFEAPGAFECWVTARGYQASYSRVYQQDVLPESAEAFDLLVVLGGPQDPATTLEQCAHFNALAECELISKAIIAGRAVVGVCLGSQLIGEALGAGFDHSPEKEIGKFPISLTQEGMANPKFSHFGETLEVGHWHNDMPGLTQDAKIIAYSEGCPRQIIEYSALVYGFQCHMELTKDVVELLIHASQAELITLADRRFVQQAAALRTNDYDEMNHKLWVFLDKLVADYNAG